MDALLSEANEIFYGGAVGGGKSHLLRVAAIVYSIQIPGLQTYIFRKTYKELIANHIHTPGGFLELLREFLDDKLVTYNKSDSSFDFQNGSRIQLAHCQYDSDVEGYLGAQIGFLAIDEATHLSDYVYKFLRSRVRLGSLEVPAEFKGMFPRILACSNPGNVSHNYWKKQFVIPGSGHIWRALPKDGGMLREFIPSKVDDNPTLIRNDPGYKDRIRGMGETHLVEAMLEGDWDIVAGGAFDDLWDRSIHKMAPFDIPRSWLIDRAYDYGSSAPYGVIWFAESNGEEALLPNGEWKSWPRGTLFLINEIYGADAEDKGTRQTPKQVAVDIRNKEREMGLEGMVMPGPADRSIFDTDRGPSIASQMEDEGISWTESDKKPGSRINGLARIRNMLQASVTGDLESPHVYFWTTCPYCIDQIPVIPRDEKKIEDVDTKANDHLYDTFRYRVLALNVNAKQVPYGGY